MTTLHDFGGVLGRPLDTFFGLSQFHGHGSWRVCEVALSIACQQALGNWNVIKSKLRQSGIGPAKLSLCRYLPMLKIEALI